MNPPEWLEPREYQRAAVDAWKNQQGQGVLNMATGTGKTITSLLAASELAALQDGRLALVIAAPYQHLVEQWRAEVREFGAQPFLAYQSKTQWTTDVAGAITEYTNRSRDFLCIITTHATFSSPHFQQLLSRIDGVEALLIADEVHHLGAPHLRESLPGHIRARLGLSATPERWYDDTGTDAIYEYFTNGVVYEYGLADAISNGYLSEYYYVPHIVELTADETEDYLALSKAIGRILSRNDDINLTSAGGPSDEHLKQLLFKRARLIGTAENKTEVLRSLIERTGAADIHHTLVYCGDGTVEIDGEGEEVKRQLRVITELLGNELGIRAHQFTYEESQATRERLLSDFAEETLQALVAIRCLDEGVDVPATQTAFMLASSTNPRQFVQRRGRILRPHESKPYSVIHDFIVAPPAGSRGDGGVSTFTIERNLLQKELQRVSTFAEHARNHPDADLARIPTTAGTISELKEEFNLWDL